MSVEIKEVTLLDTGSDILDEAIEGIKKHNPRSFIFTFVDPKTNRTVVWADGSTNRDQLGMLEMAKHMLLNKESE